MQFYQHLRCLLTRLYNANRCNRCYIQNFKTLASFCSWAGRFCVLSGCTSLKTGFLILFQPLSQCFQVNMLKTELQDTSKHVDYLKRSIRFQQRELQHNERWCNVVVFVISKKITEARLISQYELATQLWGNSSRLQRELYCTIYFISSPEALG